MDMDSKHLQFDYLRRYGVEMEVNASDGKDHIPSDKMPEGIQVIGNIISKTLCEHVEVKSWREALSHWDVPKFNKEKPHGCWLVKPDGSCGMEACSPVSKGWYGLNKICKVADALKANKIRADGRCSLHGHIEVADLTVEELASVITYWIKCELVFLDAFGDVRKNNRYCQAIGLCDWIQTDTTMNPEELVRFFGLQKYTSINTFHLNKGKRPTMEFRIADNQFCLNSYLLKNWVRLVLHFVEMAKKLPLPGKYVAGDPWSSYCWLDPKDVFKVLGWDGSYTLSAGMKQTRNWFLARMIENLGRSSVYIQSLAGRRVAHTQVFDIAQTYIEKEGFSLREAIAPPDHEDAVYNKIYSV